MPSAGYGSDEEEVNENKGVQLHVERLYIDMISSIETVR